MSEATNDIEYYLKKYECALKRMASGTVVFDVDIGPAMKAIRDELERLREQLADITVDRDEYQEAFEHTFGDDRIAVRKMIDSERYQAGRKAGLEEAAKVCEKIGHQCDGSDYGDGLLHIAEDIRARIEQASQMRLGEKK